MAKRRLGRGLDSLINPGDRPPAVETAPLATDGVAASARAGERPPDSSPAAGEAVLGAPIQVALDRIRPNPYQPRKDFDESGLEELTRSIASNGIIQPIVLRHAGDGGYELVAGERRLRAALALGMGSVPAVVKDVPDERMLELALIENIQRQDLNPIEKGEAFRDFLRRTGQTQEAAAERIGIDRATLANHLRLLELPEDIQALVRNRALAMGHARTIAGVDDPAAQIDLATRAIRQGWSVRQMEQAVARLGGRARPRRRMVPRASAEATAVQEELSRILGTRVRIEESSKKGSGRIVVEYYGLEDFDRIMGVIRR